jgi:methyl-accepting chemotaxis protein
MLQESPALELQPPHEIEDHRPATPDVVIEGLNTIGPILEVLRAQLDHVTQETEAASSTFMVQLIAIDDEVATLTDKVARLVAQTSQSAETQQLAARNAQVVLELTETVKSRDTTIRSLVAEVGALDAEADAIRRLASTTNILGLNALIVAANAGDEGAAFGVVAHEVRALSGQSDASARRLRDGINVLTQKMNDALNSIGDGASTDLDAQLAQITAMQSALEQQFASVTNGAAAIVGEVQNTAQQLASLTVDAMGGVQFQDLVRQLVEQVQRSLGRVIEHSRALAADAGGELGPEELEALRTDLSEVNATYVTQRQRETHGLVTATVAAADSSPAIELF